MLALMSGGTVITGGVVSSPTLEGADVAARAVRTGRGGGCPALGDRPETLMRVYAQAFTDARRRREGIRDRIAQGTNIVLC